MPIFEYVCNVCGQKFEKLEKSGADDERKCPACGSSDVSKAMSIFAASGSSDGKCFTGG